jgi:ATP-dependent helicase/nuclease subunit A
MEARAVAQRIRNLVENQEIPGIGYKDIVILLRSLSGWAESFQRVFEQEGIPLIVASQTGYFSASEVQTVLSMLRVLDNPCQDIPLAAVMKSYFGGFTSEELSRIRALHPDRAFYACVMDFAEETIEKSVPVKLQEKLCAFRDRIRDFRSRIPYTPIHRLIQEVLEETGYQRYVTALPGGAQRRANIDMLLEKAIAYENTSYHGLFHFIRYMDQLMKYDIDYGEAEIVSEQENAVRLMSIHKSKGLEFPVVFVSGMGKQFNQQDSRSNMIFHPEYGIGLKWFDCERRTKCDTLIRQIFALEAKRENLGEELRILYVALTRAKEKLILTGGGTLPDEGCYRRLQEEEKLDFSTRFDAKCYWDWVLPALEGVDGPYPIREWNLDVRIGKELKRQEELLLMRRDILEELKQVDDAQIQEVKQQLSWQYPYATERVKKQKVSVSELKHRAMEEAQLLEEMQEETLFAPEIPVPYVPKFMEQGKENAGAQYGTIVHRFLECFDFSTLPQGLSWKECKAFLEEQTGRMVASGRMQKEDVDRLNFYQIYQFFGTDLAARMKERTKLGLLTREKPFVMSVPAASVWNDVTGDASVLVQGIIDVFWEEADGLVLLDYKTDRVSSPQELILRYQKQLGLYARALQCNFPEKPVKEIWIYSFSLETAILLPKNIDVYN